MNKKLILPLFSTLFFCFVRQGHAAVWNVVYPRPVNETHVLSKYPVELLTLALDRTGVKYRLVPSERIMLQSKALQQIEENRELNVVWSQTDAKREQSLLPVRIPILKGLIGWRLLLIKHEQLATFQPIKTVMQLLRYAPVQAAHWTDTTILQANGFNVVTAQDETTLFDLLRHNRGDFFPRSVLEIWSEMSNPDLNEGLSIEPGLGIRYPAAMYFFVNKSNLILARLLNDGLEYAIADGSFEQLFSATFDAYIKEARIDSRRVFELENQLLTEQTPLERKELWYVPEE